MSYHLSIPNQPSLRCRINRGLHQEYGDCKMHEKSLRWWVLKPDHQEGFLVQITVSLTFDLPASADVNMVELHILDAGREAMREALRLAAVQVQA